MIASITPHHIQTPMHDSLPGEPILPILCSEKVVSLWPGPGCEVRDAVRCDWSVPSWSGGGQQAPTSIEFSSDVRSLNHTQHKILRSFWEEFNSR